MAATNNTTSSGQFSNLGDLQKTSFVIYSLLLLIGMPGNAMVFLRVWTDHTLHNPTFMAISSLAVADFLFIVWRIPLEILQILNRNWIYGTAVCKLSYLFYQVSSYSAAYHLVLLSVIRYYTLVHPLHALKNLTVKSVGVICGLLWAAIFICISSLLFTSGVLKLKYAGTTYYLCLPDPSVGITSSHIYSWCYSIFSYFLPLTVLIVFHVTKARTVARFARRMNDNRTKQMSSMVVLVLLLFGILLLPVHLKNILVMTRVMKGTSLIELDLVFRVMAYSNSCINPLAYAFISRLFRKSLTKVFPCIRPAQVSPVHNNIQTVTSRVTSVT